MGPGESRPNPRLDREKGPADGECAGRAQQHQPGLVREGGGCLPFGPLVARHLADATGGSTGSDLFPTVEIRGKPVVVGHPHQKIRHTRGVRFLGHVDQIDMPALFSGAEVLVYPSLYEGFGLPILEAYVTKTPVVTSNFGSMAEVAGMGAVLVDPCNVDDVADGILEAVKNRQKYVKIGSKLVKNYSWKKMAEETLKVYKEMEKYVE